MQLGGLHRTIRFRLQLATSYPVDATLVERVIGIRSSFSPLLHHGLYSFTYFSPEPLAEPLVKPFMYSLLEPC